jgi:hypothetical protein
MEFRNELAYGEYWHPYEWTSSRDYWFDIESEINKHIGRQLVSNVEIRFTGATDYPAYLKEDIEAIDKSRRP